MRDLLALGAILAVPVLPVPLDLLGLPAPWVPPAQLALLVLSVLQGRRVLREALVLKA